MENKEKQTEFEKGWEEYQDKKKNDIEELAKAMKGAFYCKDFDQLASVLIKQGYRKVPNCAVVIPEKITVETSSEDIIKIAKYNDEVRKQASSETAEKYKGFIRELLTNGDDSITTYYGDVKYRLIREDDLQELAKQLGVEIKE